MSLSDEGGAQWFEQGSNPVRFRILRLLSVDSSSDEMCVNDIALALDIPQTTISYHLALMRLGGSVNRRIAGRQKFYSVSQSFQETLKYISDMLLG